MNLPELKQAKNFFGKISSSFIDRYKVVFLIIFSIIIMGLISYSNIPKESVPDISLNRLYVQTAYPGASSSDIESLVSIPIENAVQGLDGVDSVSSTSNNGISSIIIKFSDDYDMDKAQTDVNNKLNNVSLPDNTTDPYVGVIETGEIPIYAITVAGDYDLVALKSYGEDIKAKIERINGIRKVELTGGYEREIQIHVDFNKLSEYGMDISSIKNALAGSNINLPSGKKGIDGELVNISVDESFKNIEDIKNILITSNTGNSVFLKDVASVSDSHKSPDNYSSYYLANGDSKTSTPAVYLTVYRTNGYDIVEPCDEISNLLVESKGTLVPNDVNLITTSDNSKQVQDDLSTVTNNALSGLITVIIILFIFIGLNEALIVSTVIPLSLLLSIAVMDKIGLSLNSISLTGFIIALGLLVDNAIVIMENVDRLREKGVDKITASKAGTNQVGPAVVSATLTTIVAFLPVVFTTGIMGKFLSVMPKTVIIIITASLLMSMVVTPSLCAKFLPKFKVKTRETKFTKKHFLSSIFIFLLALYAFANKMNISLTTVSIAITFTLIYLLKTYLSNKSNRENGKSFVLKYKAFIKKLLKNRFQKITILLLTIVVFLASIMTIPLGLLKLELIPYEPPASINVLITAPIGTLIDDTRDIVYKAENSIYKFSDIESFNTTIGSDGDNKAKITIELIDSDKRKLKQDDLINSLRNEIDKIPGAKFEIESVTSMHKISSGKEVSIGIEGDNLDELNLYAKQYYDVLKNIKGTVDSSISSENGLRKLYIDIDNNKATTYGLNVLSIANEIRYEISGVKAGIYKENGDEYDITIYYNNNKIQSVKDFDKIFFKSNNGELVNFNEVAKIKYQDGIGQIERIDGKKVVYIEANVAFGYNANEISKEFSKKTSSIELPDTIDKVLSGQSKDFAEQTTNMMINFMIALLLVYIILVIQFNSLIQPIVILLSVPFAFIGVVWGLILTGNNLGFYAMFGVVALVGIAVNDAIVLIDYINYLRKNGTEKYEAISEAVKTRFQPVIATSLTTIGGVLSLAIYNETFSQLGFALIFGLVASTLLTLLIIPIVYNAIDNISKYIANLFSKKRGAINEE
ncbi:efflux RND transporter permease subunit [Helicovermis profundi]|uniref:Efflux RND transporter permease subunit n=1 Tax=Helicovermis profundi TaxID=3065157 RepID=A0AAU9E5H5_9FIRM|nr:efflux RND transporter permease subunit [Clostridia bacterium S502]